MGRFPELLFEIGWRSISVLNHLLVLITEGRRGGCLGGSAGGPLWPSPLLAER